MPVQWATRAVPVRAGPLERTARSLLETLSEAVLLTDERKWLLSD